MPSRAATAHATAPAASPHRGFAASISPMIDAPIGVEPTNAVDHKAVTRPRNSGAEASWIVELPVVMKVMLAKPTMNSNGTATACDGEQATAAMPAA